jgi:regulation of enolase protein 1 (concanavalin A-like superfamily)
VHPGEVIRVGADSLCELQFGEESVIQVQEKTEIALEDFMVDPNKSKVSMELKPGSVLCKVSKLTGEESFTVRTRTAVCGVRGTEFLVSVSEADETLLAVKEGAVSVIPESADAQKIEREAGLDNPRIKQLIKGIEDSAVIVESHRQITIDRPTAQKTEQLINSMLAEVEKTDTKQSLTGKEEDEVSALVKKTGAQINKTMHPPIVTPPANEERLKNLDFMKIKKIHVVPEKDAGRSGETPAGKAEPALITLKINTEPADTEIFLDGLYAGKGRFRKIFEEGRTLRFTFNKTGFKARELTVEIDKTTQKEFTITLEKLTAGEQGAGPVNTEEKQQDELNEAVALKDANKNEDKQNTAGTAGTKWNMIDDFNGTNLNGRWYWKRQKRSTWSLQEKPGFLMIKSENGDIYERTNNSRNLLLTEAEQPDFMVETRLEFSPFKNWQQAGLVIYLDDDNFVRLTFGYIDGRKLELSYEKYGKFKLIQKSYGTNVVYLRLLKKGKICSGYYSKDGQNFTLISEYNTHFAVKSRIGLLAINGDGSIDSARAFFDYVRIAY